jgi:tetratricopeptide (TPR) repeat protein
MAVARVTAIAPITRQIEAALREKQFPTALDLARRHAKEQPGAAAEALLRKCYLTAAEVHVGRDSFREAHAVLTEAERLPIDDPAWWERLAELRAELGDHSRAMQLLDKVPDTTARPRVLGRVVDRALRDGPAGHILVPADLKPGFDLVIRAFAAYEGNRDAAARELLDGIGLSSPYLEWKLLIRGLMAWAANDTPRALENWARLSPDRLPAKLAAPFRLTVDKKYGATLPADRLALVTKQVDRISGGVNEGLRRLRKQLASEETIPDALETARAIVPDLKRVAPDSVPRLANIIYWALITGGQPDDLPRYQRIFGPPIDDPSFFRLQAMVMEYIRRIDSAHGMWKKYEEWIAKTPSRWPGPQAARARALVLERMGRLARDWLNDEGEDESDEFDDFFSFFVRNERRKPVKRQSLVPSAEQCFGKAAELAPDWVVPAAELMNEFAGEPAKALKAAENLLARFPSDLATLESAADLYEKLNETTKAHDCMKRALAANPLDRRLRQRAAGLALSAARQHAIENKFDDARASIREAAALGNGPLSPGVLALSSAIELRAKNKEEAGKHQESLMGLPDARLAGPYRLSVEGSRLKLTKKALGPVAGEFPAGLAGPATAGELGAILDALDQYRREPIAYRGLKSHEKKILDRIAQAAAQPDLGEDDLVRLAKALHERKQWKPLGALTERGIIRHPENPYFVYFQAESLLARQRSEYVNYRTAMMYVRLKKLLDSNKGRYVDMQEKLDERLRLTPDLDRWLNDRWGW